MCGICGKLTTDIRHRIDEEYILRMNDTLKQRGPDGAGIYISKISANTGSDSQAQVGLGHRRLSIIDLSEAARQPMRNENKTIWLTCNGEIYNFQELRKKLETAGHRFTSRSDTEVIIHLYEDRGVDCVRDLEGMFAFALWDENRKRLLLVRDRLGKKPLYYAISSSSLIFASEISAILVNHELSREIVPEAVDLYLTYGYIPAPQTIFSAVKKLLPAHILVWEDGNIRIGPYWSLSYERKIIMQEDEYCQRILELFGEAVKKRLTSDVPLGAFLSGGIDSSAVVAMMSRFSHQAIKTFSIGFSEGSFDELKYARKVARLFNTEHREYVVKADALEVLPELIRHFGEPFADSSAIATYYLSKMTRQEVTVALNGDGGDEAFGGYERYLANNLAVIYQKFPGSLRKGIAGIISGLAESTKKKDFIRNLKRFISIDGLSPEKSYAFWMSIFERGIKEELYSQDFKSRLTSIDSGNYLSHVYLQAGTRDFLDNTFSVDIATYLSNDLLVKVDIASMANSLEARSPFLDHKLMEFSAEIPSSLKVKGLTTKYILKKALRKILPDEIIKRRKQGFGVPVGAWFRNELRDYAYEVLLSKTSIARGYFQPEKIRSMLDGHVSGRVNHGQRIWSLLNLELWHRIFMDNH